MKKLNILILGETGVGKSTWINSLANYMTHAELGDALKHKPIVLIPTSFVVTNDDFEDEIVKVGEDKNDNQQTGHSGTLEPKAYVFKWNEFEVRLIDTPGIGDTRGLAQDRKNFESILRYLSHHNEIHGICILLKPNNSKLTILFQFCMKELLTYLHRDASKNIVFCFTNSRSTFYKPGDTLPALRKLLDERKNIEVEITLNKSTIYCMDNEPFRFLCAYNQGIKFDNNDKKNFSASWDKSFQESQRMMLHIAELKPHNTKQTLSLNDARQIILNLTKPLAELSQNIQSNIAVVVDKKEMVKNINKRKADLKKSLYIPSINLVSVPLGHPRTVCTAASCVKYHSLGPSKQTTVEFITHCHKECSISGVIPECFPDARLRECAAMDKSLNCYFCGCSWEKHMHITYESKREYCDVIDITVQNEINQKQNDEEKTECFIKILEKRVKDLEDEQKTISHCCTKFAYFLKKSALCPYNDALPQYLDMLIDQENGKVNQGGDKKTLDNLKKMKAEYEEQARTLEDTMQNASSDDASSPESIYQLVETLYTLPLSGVNLKANMKVILDSKNQALMQYHDVYVATPVSKEWLDGLMDFGRNILNRARV